MIKVFQTVSKIKLTRKSEFRATILIIALSSLIFRYLIYPYPISGMHDDQLMVEIANNILDGKWLGIYEEFGNRLLSKPPGYAIFLVFTSWLPWAPTVSVHLFLLLGLVIISREIRFLGESRAFTVGFFLFVSFYPAWFDEPMSRIYRDGLLAAISAIVLGLSLMTRRQMLDYLRKPYRNIWESPLCAARHLTPPTIIGALLACFIVSKNTWLYMVVLVVFVTLTPANWVNIKSKAFIKTYLPALLATSLCCFTLIAVLLAKNEATYGVRQLDTYTSGPFADAMKVLYSVRDTQNRAYVDISEMMRLNTYEVSPTFAKLKPFLEIPEGAGWRSQPCQSELEICDESAAWFPWDLRDAVETAGLGSSAADFNSTFAMIASEVRGACKSGKINCDSPGMAPGVDSLNSLSPRALINAFSYAIGDLLNPDVGRSDRPLEYQLEDERKWSRIVKNLPPKNFSTRYEVQSAMLDDSRRVLARIYSAIWPLILIMAFTGLARGLLDKRKRSVAFLGILVLSPSFILIAQLSLVEASSGVFISGSRMYLLCLYPLLFTGVALGMHSLLAKFQAN